MAEEVEKPARRVMYCPKCGTRYTYDIAECEACSAALSPTPPRDESLFKPRIDIPFVLFAIAFIAGYGRLTGEAQSFGLIFLIVGCATIIAFRAIAYAEWLGRR